MKISLERWNENSVSVERGPLVYALKVDESWEKKKNNDQYGDYYEVHPLSPWNYGLLEIPKEKWQQAFQVITNEHIADYPWTLADAPVELKTSAVRLPNWQLYNGNAGPLPYSPQPMPPGEKPVTVTLIPYGCTTLRITEFPVVH